MARRTLKRPTVKCVRDEPGHYSCRIGKKSYRIAKSHKTGWLVFKKTRVKGGYRERHVGAGRSLRGAKKVITCVYSNGKNCRGLYSSSWGPWFERK